MKNSKQHSGEYDCIVIGGGASGLMAAGRAAELGARVLILERNNKLGEKLKITGGGRCNITNAEFNIPDFLENYGKAKDFLHSPFSQFSAKDTFSFFESLGLPLVVEARNRAFPASQKALDVFRTLECYIKKHKVTVKTNVRVKNFKMDNDKLVSIVTHDKEEFRAPYFILSTGGLAAPETGSTGDGFRMLERIGHSISKPNPNLVPLTTKVKWVHRLSGVTLSFMAIRFKQNGKQMLKRTGKLLFTHFGVSGPLILNSSYEVKQLLKKGRVNAEIDCFPDTQEDKLDRRIYELFKKNKNKMLKNVFAEILPAKLAEVIIYITDPNLLDRPVHSVTKAERMAIVQTSKHLGFEISGTLGFKKSIVADGGLNLEEVDTKHMSSKQFSNLYLLGDVLNVNRPSGGFSLQLCWTTAWVAANSITKKLTS